MKAKYTTDPKEIYTLELNELQRVFSDLQRVGEEVSEVSKVGWREVEHIRHLNFIIQEAVMTGESLLKML